MTAGTGTDVRARAPAWCARLLSSAVLLGVATLHIGCGNACSALADKICQCEPNANQEAACLLRKDRASNREVSAEEDERCSALLDTCTCEALAVDNLAACGLSNSD